MRGGSRTSRGAGGDGRREEGRDGSSRGERATRDESRRGGGAETPRREDKRFGDGCRAQTAIGSNGGGRPGRSRRWRRRAGCWRWLRRRARTSARSRRSTGGVGRSQGCHNGTTATGGEALALPRAQRLFPPATGCRKCKEGKRRVARWLGRGRERRACRGENFARVHSRSLIFAAATCLPPPRSDAGATRSCRRPLRRPPGPRAADPAAAPVARGANRHLAPRDAPRRELERRFVGLIEGQGGDRSRRARASRLRASRLAREGWSACTGRRRVAVRGTARKGARGARRGAGRAGRAARRKHEDELLDPGRPAPVGSRASDRSIGLHERALTAALERAALEPYPSSAAPYGEKPRHGRERCVETNGARASPQHGARERGLCAGRRAGSNSGGARGDRSLFGPLFSPSCPVSGRSAPRSLSRPFRSLFSPSPSRRKNQTKNHKRARHKAPSTRGCGWASIRRETRRGGRGMEPTREGRVKAASSANAGATRAGQAKKRGEERRTECSWRH